MILGGNCSGEDCSAYRITITFPSRGSRGDERVYCYALSASLLKNLRPGSSISRGPVDDLAKEYEAASVVIAPIFSGGGTQVKVLEGLAYGKGLVVSEFALAGFQPRIAAGTHVEVATRPQDWAERCLSLIRDRHPHCAARKCIRTRARPGRWRMGVALLQVVRGMWYKPARQRCEMEQRRSRI